MVDSVNDTTWRDDSREIDELLARMDERDYRERNPDFAMAMGDNAAWRRLDELKRAGSDTTGIRKSWKRPPGEELEIARLESELAGMPVTGVVDDWSKSPSYRAMFDGIGDSKAVIPLGRLTDVIEAATILFPGLPKNSEVVEGQQLLPMPTGPLGLFTVDDSFNRLVVRVPSIKVTTPASYGGLAVDAPAQETVLEMPAPTDRDMTRVEHAMIAPRWGFDPDGRDADPIVRKLLQYIGMRELFRLLVVEAFRGDGSSVAGGREQLLGVLNQTTGLQTKAYSTSQLQTVVEARALLETASFPGPYVLIMHPTDKAKLSLAADLSVKLPDVEVIGSADAIAAAGTAVLAQKGVATLRTSQLQVFLTLTHSDFLLRSLVTVKPSVHAHVDLPAAVAAGVVKITGLV
jgi:hypothetical protein